ncbi:hypothetical protein [Cryobacterium sp. MLB-32]|nr:hypothetical protein [Cryobacterium sp. MLB-32]
MNNDLEFPDGELPDDDPDIVAGMERLRILREHEDETPDFSAWQNRPSHH